ncbi:hypothetical protein OS493_006853 [Desmophyllum pertusum]|uniref:Uncharacterized protein n=1 Tax=Desmophyllum pertusum TaxID=174260 RepID=A0A9W9ZRX3_9CNID|nr:hypothetical protein OS493_006853 [Desmophyllum pertusum]
MSNPRGSRSPDTAPMKINGYQPSNCDKQEREIAKFESIRDAYREVTAYIDSDPSRYCCTIEAGNQVKFWKATELPVQLKKVDGKITFFHSEELTIKWTN